MMGFGSLVKRNCKLFFKDKGLFFSSMITPLILLVLYVSFLANVYKDSFVSNMPEGLSIDEKLIDAVVGGQLISSLLAVTTVTLAFCSNLIMVQDKALKSRLDLTISPVKKSTLALSYYVSCFLTTFMVCMITLVVGFIYLMATGWFMSFIDLILIIFDVFLLSLFGTALSSIVNMFLSTQGQMAAVGTIVSSCYGFICGAYMPISQFGNGLQKALSFLPGTYGTSLIKNHTLNGAYRQMSLNGFPKKVIESIKDSIDCNIYFFENQIEISTMYLVLCGTITLLIVGYILLNYFISKKRNNK